MKIENEKLYLIESKHSKSRKLPSIGDVKDGLLKMRLYTNLENVYVEGNLYESFPVLRLTSEKIAGEISSELAEEECENFFRINNFNKRQTELMKSLFAEAKENRFIVSLGKI